MPKLFTMTTAVLALALVATSVSAGVRVIEETEGQARQRRATELAGKLIGVLPGILERFQARRRDLPAAPGGGYQAAGVESLLRDTEAELRGTLAGEDLAPLRDHVSAVFQSVRERLGLPRQAGFLLEMEGDEVNRGAADGTFEQIVALIQKILSRSKADELTMNLCVVSRPSGAAFRMNAPSLPEKPYSAPTMGELVNVFLGQYDYELKKTGLPTVHCAAGAPCGPIDLWDDSRPVLACDLTQAACQRRESERGDCPKRKRH